MNHPDISPERIDKEYSKLKTESEKNGYYLNPDLSFTLDLIKGLLINESRYGYRSCPCRLSTGSRADDLDIICPCDYRDADVSDFNTCFCALYVSKDVIDGKASFQPIPERRAAVSYKKEKSKTISSDLAYPVWRCKVCGYICARETPPSTCPICKADKDRFERFM